MAILGTSAAAKDGDPAKPKSRWDVVVTATPVIMSVLATLLAGLSSSEMSRAMYDRSLAAQNQAKAGDQWNYYQAKRTRSIDSKNSLDLLIAMNSDGTVDPGAQLAAAAERLSGALGYAGDTAATAPATTQEATTQETVGALITAIGGLPKEFPVLKGKAVDPRIAKAMAATVDDQTKDQLSKDQLRDLLEPIGDKDMRHARGNAQETSDDFDKAIAPALAALDGLERLVSLERKEVARMGTGDAATRPAAGVESDRISRAFMAYRLGFDNRRYNAEANYNLAGARLLELEVARSNFSSDRHRERSNRFFYGMLMAQSAVVVSTLAIALRKRSVLWGMSAAAGLIAVSLGAYVYFGI